jgi:TIR domain
MAKKLFISYSHQDAEYLGNLKTHLAPLIREKLVELWADIEIRGGGRIDSMISDKLGKADIFVALVSPDFLASNYCYENELAEALRREEIGSIIVFPIILRPCDWLSSPLKELKALPRDGKPVSDWDNIDTPFLDIATELRKIIDAEVVGAPNQDTLREKGDESQGDKSTTIDAKAASDRNKLQEKDNSAKLRNTKLEDGSKLHIDIARGMNVDISGCSLSGGSEAKFLAS